MKSSELCSVLLVKLAILIQFKSGLTKLEMERKFRNWKKLNTTWQIRMKPFV
jgi:hypothetical protein